jgi:hypothetical protein
MVRSCEVRIPDCFPLCVQALFGYDCTYLDRYTGLEMSSLISVSTQCYIDSGKDINIDIDSVSAIYASM